MLYLALYRSRRPSLEKKWALPIRILIGACSTPDPDWFSPIDGANIRSSAESSVKPSRLLLA